MANRVKPAKRNTPLWTANDQFLHLLDIIEQQLPLALHKQDIEPIHQLRVTFRRLRNGFWLYQSNLPKQRLAKWREALRRAGRACGRCRDLDVQIEFLVKRSTAYRHEARPLQPLIHSLKAKRQKFAVPMRRVLRALSQGPILKSLRRYFTDPGSRIIEDHRLLAEKRIQKRYRKLFLTASPLPDPQNVTGLHQMRIQAKRLRYTLEFFTPLKGVGLKLSRQIPSVIALQRVLGEIHDFDVWQEEWTVADQLLWADSQRKRTKAYKRLKNLWQDFISGKGQLLRE